MNVTEQAKGTPIGVNDKHGRAVHIGDTLHFDEKKWGSAVNATFVVELIDGEIVHNGVASDFEEYCEIVIPWDAAKP